MVLSLRMSLFGLQMMFLINIVQAFVLLTANIEDVKKLARKFVSESLAEQIADFLSSVSNVKVNLSEENEMSQLHQVSGEIHPKKGLRENHVRNKTGTKFKQSHKIAPISTEKSVHFHNRSQNPHQSKLHSLATLHNYGVIKFEPTTHTISRPTTRTTKKHHPSKQKHRTDSSKIDSEAKMSAMISAARESRNINNNLLSKYIADQAKSTHGYAEIAIIDKNNEPDLLKFDKDEIGKSPNVGKKETNSSDRVDRVGLKLTSKKLRIEFDQYDNFKYSKIMATSGPVTLPKVQASSWWDNNDYESMKTKEERKTHLKKQLTWF